MTCLGAQMNIRELPSDPMPNGPSARRFALTSSDGLVAEVSAFGARLMAVLVPMPNGSMRDIVVGHDKSGDHVKGDRCAGATCGRFAGRIAKARFSLDGVEYPLAANIGPNHLHGGPEGFDRRLWDAEIAGDAVQFRYTSVDGEEGYPGALTCTVTYRFVDGSSLEILHQATTSKPTVLNLTNHSYWNLNGNQQRDCGDHLLQVFADRWLVIGDALIPSGELEPIAGTVRDYRQPRPLADALRNLPIGLDLCYELRGKRGELKPAARVIHPPSGLTLEAATSEPALQVYTAVHFGPEVIGKGGEPLRKYGALALEPQNFPNTPNLPGLPSSVLRPGKTYRNLCRFTVSSR